MFTYVIQPLAGTICGRVAVTMYKELDASIFADMKHDLIDSIVLQYVCGVLCRRLRVTLFALGVEAVVLFVNVFVLSDIFNFPLFSVVFVLTPCTPAFFLDSWLELS